MSEFEDLMAAVDYPMLVVTARAGNGDQDGCLVGFATQCSIDPAHYLVLLSKQNRTYEVARRSDLLVVHVLRATDRDLARQFGETSGDWTDKLQAVDWSPGPGRVPVLTGVDWFAGRIQQRFDCGDHVAHLIAVLPEGRAANPDAPQLGFQAVQDFDAGHDA
jgi:flavin reductase (DIM6/NTAB) family NADH-FMN oxidoreductase RutF